MGSEEGDDKEARTYSETPVLMIRDHSRKSLTGVITFSSLSFCQWGSAARNQAFLSVTQILGHNNSYANKLSNGAHG